MGKRDLWRHVTVAESGCWHLASKPRPDGYTQINLGGGKIVYAHRYYYELRHGPIPAGLVMDHLCRNPRCVNPDHLEAVTQGENVRRGKRRITHCPHGHAYEGENVKINVNGARICCECARRASRDWQRARRAMLKQEKEVIAPTPPCPSFA